MKSTLFFALAMFAMATTGCALQSGGGSLCNQDCGEPCTVMSGDCNCGAPKGLTPSGGLFRRLGDQRGMAMRLNGKGSACNQGKGSGLFSRFSDGSAGGQGGCSSGSCGGGAGAGSCGCNAGDSVVSISGGGDCGCNAGDTLVSMSGGGDCGCNPGDTMISMSGGDMAYGGAAAAGAASGGGLFGGGCLSGKCGLGGGGCGLGGGGCALKGKLGGGGCALKGKLGGGCGAGGCGLGGKLLGAGQHPYGGAIPHTAQAPGVGTGMAPAYAYPYYTTRGPRDFLMKKPPSIGY